MQKTTQSPERRSPSVAFNLQDMGLIYERTHGEVDVPHRHDYYTVLLVEEANGKHLVDYQTHDFGSSEVYFVSPGQVHQVALDARPKGWAFTFSRDFLVENNIPEGFITNISLFRLFGDAPPLQIDKTTFQRLRRIVDEMESCLPMHLEYRSRALGALLQLFLIYCHNSTSFDQKQIDEESPGICLLRDFKQMVDDKFRYWHKVSEYAGEIPISAKHLSSTVKKITGKSAKAIIQDRLLLEAKRLLLHTDLSVKEVGYRIGFEEPLHFSSFFKKQVGVSPSKFRDI